MYTEKNILSYGPGTVFKGSEIKAWIRYHINHDCGKKTQMANKMKEYLNIDDNADYVLVKCTYSSCESYGNYLVERAEKHKEYA